MSTWLAAQQARLKALGFYQSTVDGLDGPSTQRAFELAIAAAERAAGVQPPAYPALPSQYSWLNTIGTLPLIVHEALKLIGTVEVAGRGSSSIITGWARELGIANVYSDDSIPWCGLFAGIVASRAKKDIGPVGNILWARNWAKFGNRVDGDPALGDICVFARGNAGHVAEAIAVDADGFIHILGGNQGDAVNIMRKHKKDLLAVRRPVYKDQPASVRVYSVAASGKVSSNEQ